MSIVRLGRALGPGTYTVNWRALSVDTHTTTGHVPLHRLLNRSEARGCAICRRPGLCHVICMRQARPASEFIRNHPP